MKIAIFDVSNGNCALAVCPNGNSMMLDCGYHTEKDCPVQTINELRLPNKWLEHMKSRKIGQKSYPLTKLVVSHPDLDHIKNIQKVHKELTPYFLHRRYLENFPPAAVHQEDENYAYYRDRICATYRADATWMPDWGFTSYPFQIQMQVLKDDPRFGESKLKNNSSIVYLIDYQGFRILFCGDMEEVGWNWLIENDENFKSKMLEGVDVIVASHHGHTSGYSQNLMNLIGAPKLAILSKGSEEGEGTVVDSRYSATATGYTVKGLSSPEKSMNKKTLTTRRNGNIYMVVDHSGEPSIYADRVF